MVLVIYNRINKFVSDEKQIKQLREIRVNWQSPYAKYPFSYTHMYSHIHAHLYAHIHPECFLKRYVLSLVLQKATDSAYFISRGIRFHAVEPLTLKLDLHTLHSSIMGCGVDPASRDRAHNLIYV